MLEQSGDAYYDEENSRSSVPSQLLSSKNTPDCKGVRCQFKLPAFQKSGRRNAHSLAYLIQCFQHVRGCTSMSSVFVILGALMGILAFIGMLLVASNIRAQLIAMQTQLQLEKVLKLKYFS